jgi:N-acetyl-gamma-glutamyl-phosphate reductase
MSRPRIFIDGHEGTTGLRIHEMLGGRDDLELLAIDPALRKDPTERGRLLNAADVAFLCLPDAAAREAASLVTSPRTCLIDASTAHRTDPNWVFGLPELTPGQRAAIRATQRIANPGCHASSFILLLRPLVDAGLVPRTALLTATSLTGYSGGGKKMIEQYQRVQPPANPALPGANDDALASPRPYGLNLKHKHLPEMVAHTGLATPPVFLPVVGDFYKGLAVMVPLHLSTLAPRVTPQQLRDALADRYAGEACVRVAPLSDAAVLDNGFLDVQASNDSNRADLFVFASDQQALLVARLDNLGKGASGAAVQCMNVHLGLPELAGLSV